MEEFLTIWLQLNSIFVLVWFLMLAHHFIFRAGKPDEDAWYRSAVAVSHMTGFIFWMFLAMAATNFWFGYLPRLF